MQPIDSFLQSLSRVKSSAKSKFLLAVSGGLDSMVMMHLFHKAGLDAGVAHCNFKLRGEESESDEKLVRETAGKFGFTFYSKSFHTTAFAKDNGISIQMAARKLRYDWFHELALGSTYDLIVTAHHSDDQVETILINLIKGTGIAGMHGIPEISGKIIRPLIRLTRIELLSYAHSHQIIWREDASNQDSTYERNFIRNEIIPMLQNINPSVSDAINKHASIMGKYENLINHFISDYEKHVCRFKFNGVFKTINMEKLLDTPEAATVLFHLTRHTGLTFQQCENAVDPNTSPGAEFKANSWTLTRDRNELVLYESESIRIDEEVQLTAPGDSVCLQFGAIDSTIIENIVSVEFNHPNFAFLDADKIQWPLQIRKVKYGDRFQPLGMANSKLVSDFFTDGKLGTPEKSSSYLLLSNGTPIWLCPFRIDDRFKLDESTRKVIRLSFTKQ